MSLDGALSIASGSLANINRQIALVSQNVANASTPGYVREVSTQESVTADGVGMGVRSGPAQRSIDAVLQASALTQNGKVAELSTRQSALQAIDATLGTPSQNTDLASLVGGLQNAFTTLADDPQNSTQQQAVVSAASTLATGIRTLSASYTTQRQAAQDAVVSGVSTLNTAFDSVSSLTTQIIALKSAGQSTADLESQRDASLQTISGLVNLKTLDQSNGNVVLIMGGGLSPPLSVKDPFSASSATMEAGSSYPGGGVPGIMLGGADVTSQMAGGSIGANIALRDADLPTDQAELDEFSQNLATRFDAQGLRLFSDPSGNIAAGGGTPAQSGYIGFASAISVNPTVAANPTLVRDGTQAVTGSTTGASAFTPNPTSGPAGFTALISRVLDYTFGNQVRSGVGQPALTTSGLGATGMLSAPYSGGGSLSTIAAALVGAQSQQSANVSTQLTSEQSLQTALQGKIASANGVNIDTEMSTMVQLQNAYGASARIISAAQAMWTQLLNAVQ